MTSDSHAATASMPTPFTTKYLDFAAYLVASGKLPYRGARLSSTDGEPCVVFWFEDTQDIGKNLIRKFYQSKCNPIDPKMLLDAHRFIKREMMHARQTAEVR